MICMIYNMYMRTQTHTHTLICQYTYLFLYICTHTYVNTQTSTQKHPFVIVKYKLIKLKNTHETKLKRFLFHHSYMKSLSVDLSYFRSQFCPYFLSCLPFFFTYLSFLLIFLFYLSFFFTYLSFLLVFFVLNYPFSLFSVFIYSFSFSFSFSGPYN